MSELPFTLVILPEALRYVERLPKQVRGNIRSRLDGLAALPQPQMAKPLKGMKGTWRLRVGDYRIIYRIDHAQRQVTVIHVGNRKDVYRDL
jgi:mRNA interferase RelE/StbE